MHRVTSKWRLLALLAPVAAVVAAVVLSASDILVGGNIASSTGPTSDIGGVTCADIHLLELQKPVASAITFNAGDPPPKKFKVANTITATDHNTTTNQTKSAQTVYNLFIPGAIAGALSYPIPECARIDKKVADLVDNPSDPGNEVTVTVTPDGTHPPLKDMIVYWDSDNTNQQDFWYISKVNTNDVTLKRIPTANVLINLLGFDPSLTQMCNGVPGTKQTAPGDLLSCAPTNKGIEAQKFAHAEIVKSPDVPSLHPGTPRTVITGSYDQKTGLSTSTTCVMSTSKSESANQNEWLRTEVVVKNSIDNSLQTPGYGYAKLYNPTKPVFDGSNNLIDCVNIPPGGSFGGRTFPLGTLVSTNSTVAWSLDSALPAFEGSKENFDSDYDKDGCLDWDELGASPSNVAPTATPSGPYQGGRDPQNPLDCDRNFDSIVNLQITANPVTWNKTNTERDPGAYFHCRADVQHTKDSGNKLNARTYCYVDAYDEDLGKYLGVNAAAGADDCTDAGGDCGDGLTGGSYPLGTGIPPAPYGDIDDHHVVLTGDYDKTTDEVSLEGCFDTGDDHAHLGTYMYMRMVIDAGSGHGTADIWVKMEDPGGSTRPCTAAGATAAGDPAGLTDGTNPGYNDANVTMVEIAAKGDDYDYDLDGCSDKKELGDDQTLGGLRDPYNHWDYFNPSNNQYPDLTTDILPVAFKYHLRDKFETEVVGQTASGQNQIDVTVEAGHSIQEGDTITIGSGGTAETKEVASGGVDLTNFPTATLTLTTNLANKHSDGEAVVRPRDENVPMDPLPPQSYDPEYDRNGHITGGNSWNLRPPAGYIDLTTAILKVAMQYHHDCR